MKWILSSEFDLIFSNAALQWVKDHERLLWNCRKALKPNGVIHFNFAGDGNCSNSFEVVRKVISQSAYSEYFHFRMAMVYADVRSIQGTVWKTN